jgi:hypothetical protein
MINFIEELVELKKNLMEIGLKKLGTMQQILLIRNLLIELKMEKLLKQLQKLLKQQKKELGLK